MVNKKKILFVCTGNSCRSQIAHGLMNKFAGEKFEIYTEGERVLRKSFKKVFFRFFVCEIEYIREYI